MKPVLAIAAAYLLGAIPFGLLLGRARGVDIRRHGSGNIGATNVARVLGRRWGLAAFACDFAKGWLPVFLLPGWAAAGATTPAWLGPVCCVAAIFGHNWSVFLRFRGGKGIATSAGGLLALAPLPVLVAAAVWVAVVWSSGFVSLGSIVAACSLPVWTALTVEPGPRAVPLVLLTVLLAAIAVAKHRSNLQRLRAGTESRVGWARRAGR